MKRLLVACAFLLASIGYASAGQGIIPCTATTTNPAPGAQTVSVSNSAASIQFSNCGPTALVWNVGAQEVFYSVGPSGSAAATSSGNSIPGNSFVVLNVGYSQLVLSAITATSTSTLRITQGVTQ
jgi:hypothetical protein